MLCDDCHGDKHIRQIILCALFYVPSSAGCLCSQTRDERFLYQLWSYLRRRLTARSVTRRSGPITRRRRDSSARPRLVDQEATRAEEAQRFGSKPRKAVFHGAGGTLFGIHLVNTLVTLLTLGLYYYWAKVRVRMFLFSQTEFAGDRFSYHGNARELLNGALKASLVFGVPYYLLSNVGFFLESDMAIQVALQVAGWLLLLLFIPVAIVSSRRYRLSRTAWRGIRFSFQGKTLDFLKLWLSGYFLTGVTLGLYYPYFSTRKQTFLTAHSYFGSEPFKFSGDGAVLFRPFLRVYLLAVTIAIIAVLGLYPFIELPSQGIVDPETVGPLDDRSNSRPDHRRAGVSFSLAPVFSDRAAVFSGTDVDRLRAISIAHTLRGRISS